ncbi:MAG: SPOR domain-containing protein [Steroidobacteraceae bacterium]
MSTTPIGRDFKRAGKRGRTEFHFNREFFAGLGLGLIVAAGVFVWQQQAMHQAADAAEPAQPKPQVVRRESVGTEAEEPPPKYGFYDMLPRSEVVVPETDPKAPAPNLPSTPIERPGVYVLQPGVFKNLQEAEQLQAKLLRLGVRSIVQRVAIDNDVFHRLRVGPINDLGELNRYRATLQRADIDVVVIRVGD